MLSATRFPRTATFRKIAVALWAALLLAGVLRPVAEAGTGKEAPEVVSAGLEAEFKQGYIPRADSWGGDLTVDGSRRIEHTLLRGNDYRFVAYTTTKGAKISVHVQDREGSTVETRCWQKEKDEGCFAGADIAPKETGNYYLVVKIEQSPLERTAWQLVYAYK